VNTLKSAAVIVVLLAVLYGVFVALNKPLLPLDPAATVGENPPMLIEYGPSAASVSALPATAPLVRGHDENPAAAPRSVRGGDYYPNLDTGSLPPPPTTIPSTVAPPQSPAAAAVGGLQRSAYESPVTSPAANESSSAGSASASVSPAAESTAKSAAPALAAYALRHDLTEAEQLVAAGRFRAALVKLSPHQANADLPSDERANLLTWLDALAAKVIYSRDHLVAPAHQVRKGETLYDIAHQHNVEPLLLQNINREVTDPLVLVPGTELKVVPGPFRADVNLTTGQITVLAGELYAGRFPFALGDQPPQPGEYKVVDKRAQQKTFVGFDGRVIAANDPANPYGGWWISLGGEVALHGSPLVPTNQTLGCISLSPQDAQDLYSILTLGCEVKIRR
jgi:lipoprotein-anchoring transpeptidase ErfK/SrfK